MKNHYHIDALILVLAGLGMIAAYFLFPRTYPDAGAHASKTRLEILRQAEAVLDHLKFSREKLEATIDFRANRNLLAFGQISFGAAEANQLFAHELPAFFWQVQYAEAPGLKLLRLRGSDNLSPFRYENLLQFDTHGRLLGLKLSLPTEPDSLNPDLEKAQALAFGLLPFSMISDTSEFVLEKSQKSPRDYELAWNVPSTVAGLKTQLEAKIQGTRLVQWRLKYTPLAAAHNLSQPLRKFGRALSGLLILVFAVGFFLKKLRAEAISLKAGLPVAIIAVLGFGLTIEVVGIPKNFLEWLVVTVAILFSFVFIFVSFLIHYSAGESLMRSTGQDRLLTLQAIQRCRWWYQPVGESLWRGAALGLILFGVVTFILNRLGIPAHAFWNPENEILPYYTAGAAPLTVLGDNLSQALFGETTYRLFLIAMLFRYFRKSWVVVALVTIVSGLVQTQLFELEPFGLSFGINALIGLALTLIYLRFDFLTTVVASLTLPLLLHGFSFLNFGKIAGPLNGWIILALPMLFIIGGQIIRRFGRSEIDTQALLPDYLERLAEKARMKRELEIAREVQLTFLPQQMPAFAGFDVAALCVPAHEVGGDYYDFVKFDAHRLGVLVGDVSGKGIAAAFYMTFTKAMIKTLVQKGLSPAQVLIQANRIFYKNARRGTFISLTYGIFDLADHTFTSARAGHNPVLLMSQQPRHATLIAPKGMALGLEAGEIFARNIEEQKLVINNGDAFVFYTDGFTEAMNERNEEFGESRMIEVLSNANGVSSHATINNLRNAVQIFSGETPQHDDMTMVVVKIL